MAKVKRDEQSTRPEVDTTTGEAAPQPDGQPDPRYVLNKSSKDLLRSTIASDLTEPEFQIFVYNIERTGLDPFVRQIYFTNRTNNTGENAGKRTIQVQATIDGFRLIAERTGQYEGQVGPFWCGSDGEWMDVWTKDGPPVAAKVGVWRKGFREPVWAVARYAAYVQKKYGGDVNAMWTKMPDLMTGKCAEALALRRTFPNELSGVYTAEEMAQADNDEKGETRQTQTNGSNGQKKEEPEFNDGKVRVIKTEAVPYKKRHGNKTVDDTFWRITFSDRSFGSTFSRKMFELADVFKAEKTPVIHIIEHKTSTDGKKEYYTLTELAKDETPVDPPANETVNKETGEVTNESSASDPVQKAKDDLQKAVDKRERQPGDDDLGLDDNGKPIL